MGRWSQRTRGGGGLNALIEMIAVERTGPTTAIVTFSANVNAAALGNEGWTSSPSGEVSTTLTQLTNRTIEMEFTDVIEDDSQLVYGGADPGFLDPQTIAYP